MRKIISVENLSKRYEIGARARLPTFRDAVADFFKNPFGLIKHNRGSEEIWALRDVSFEVEPGARVGIIGANGAGKSTLFKILARVTEPTDGRVRLYGQVGSLLEVGTGFHPELTGRENIYLNGSILGMKKSQIDRMFDEIVAFAEIDKFLDTPVKHYSTGMYMRLAFAVAAHLESDILLVDEVLAVGDNDFQRRCLGKMSDVARHGRTVLFVSHNMASVSSLCEQCIWIDHGVVQASGQTHEVVSRYLSRNRPKRAQYVFDAARLNGSKVVLNAVSVKNQHGEVSATLDARQPFYVAIDYEIPGEIQDVWVGFTIHTNSGVDVLAAADGDVENYLRVMRAPGQYTSTCKIPANLFNAGHFLLSAYAAKTIAGRTEIFANLEQVITFDVDHAGGIGEHMPRPRIGIVSPRLDWQVETRTTAVDRESSTKEQTENAVNA